VAKIPKSLQPILWSRDVNNLNLKKDRAYIINQILAYGTADHLKWLFKNYPRRIVVNTFVEKPIKVYSPSAFNFVKTILLSKEKDIRQDRYVENLPRNIR